MTDNTDGLTPEEIERRAGEITRRLLNTPPVKLRRKSLDATRAPVKPNPDDHGR